MEVQHTYLRVVFYMQVAAHLPGSLSFQTTAPSPLAPRHRNRHVQSHLAVDSSGAEHLLLHFYVTSSPVAAPSTGWFSALEEFQWDWEWSDVERYMRLKTRDTWDAARRAVAYISGTPLPTSAPQIAIPASGTEEKKQSNEGWGFFGLFKGLRGGKGKGKDEGVGNSGGILSDCGEVHVDFVKVSCCIRSDSCPIKPTPVGSHIWRIQIPIFAC